MPDVDSPTEGVDTPLRSAVTRFVAGVQGFAADMQAAGIHVGLGSTPRCVTCGEAWPCGAPASGGKKAQP